MAHPSLAKFNDNEGVLAGGTFERGRFRVEVAQARKTPKFIEIYARAYRDGEQVGFGADGSVDLERFVFPNPCVRLDDPTGDIVIQRPDGELRVREDPHAALRWHLAHTIGIAAKRGDKVVRNRVGNTTYTIFSQEDQSSAYSFDVTYSTARSGSSITTDTTLRAGQDAEYTVYEGFADWDTSTVVGTVSSVTCSLYLLSDSSTTDFTMQGRLRDFGSSVTTGDYVAGGSQSGLTQVCSIGSSGIGSTGAYKDLTSDAAFLSNISATNTRLLFGSSRTVSNTTPTGNEYLNFIGSQYSGSNQPKLVVQTASAGSGLLAFCF